MCDSPVPIHPPSNPEISRLCIGGISCNYTNLMDEKVMKKSSKIDKSNWGIGFELEPNKGKKKKHKNRKKKNGTEKLFISNETHEENCTGEAAERQTFSIEGDITFMGNGEEESHTNKRRKRKWGKDSEIVNSNIADDKEMQLLDDNQQSKMKKRKNRDDSFAGMQEMAASKPSKKGKKTEKGQYKVINAMKVNIMLSLKLRGKTRRRR